MADYYGATSFEASLADEFFAGYGGAPATMLFKRYSGGGGRPHCTGPTLANLTLKDLQSISGSLLITFQGSTWPEPITYSAPIILSGVPSFAAAAKTIESALNSSLQVAAYTSESFITPTSVSFTGSITGDLLQITSVSSGSIKLGAEISGPGGIPIGQIVTQRAGPPGGPGLFTLFAKAGTFSSETMTETYGVLTVGSVSGTVAVGEKVSGADVLPMTAIDGPGPPPGTWLVNNAQTVGGPGGESMTMAATPLVVNYNSLGERNFFEIQPNGQFGYDYNASTLSFASGTVADELGLTQASEALDSSPGGASQSASVYMNNLVQNEYSQLGSYQATWQTLAELDPEYLLDLAAWAQSTGDLYTFLSQSPLTDTPAGRIEPADDRPGWHVQRPGRERANDRSARHVQRPGRERAELSGPAARRRTIPAITRPTRARRRRSRCRARLRSRLSLLTRLTRCFPPSPLPISYSVIYGLCMVDPIYNLKYTIRTVRVELQKSAPKPLNGPDRDQNYLLDKFHASSHASSHADSHGNVRSSSNVPGLREPVERFHCDPYRGRGEGIAPSSAEARYERDGRHATVKTPFDRHSQRLTASAKSNERKSPKPQSRRNPSLSSGRTRGDQNPGGLSRSSASRRSHRGRNRVGAAERDDMLRHKRSAWRQASSRRRMRLSETRHHRRDGQLTRCAAFEIAAGVESRF